MTPDWQLPPGVDRGLWDYLHSAEMVAGYDDAMAVSALATVDVAFCEAHFAKPGRFVDLGCGTGRLAKHFAAKGYDCLGIDLSDEMLVAARRDPTTAAKFEIGNLTDLTAIADGSFDYAACLFSTLGMIRGEPNRRKALAEARRILKPGGTFVVHVHNRYFVRELGLRGFRNADLTMPQAYGGAALTLTHFSRRSIGRWLRDAGFAVTAVQPVATDGPLRRPWLLPGLRAYGYLVAATATPGRRAQ
jgi:SAM-dependent methyltransferase